MNCKEQAITIDRRHSRKPKQLISDLVEHSVSAYIATRKTNDVKKVWKHEIRINADVT